MEQLTEFEQLTAFEGVLMLVGQHLGSLDRANARLASKALARALAAGTSKLSVSVMAFEHAMPGALDSLATAAPAATEAVLYVKAEQDYWECTFVHIFSMLADKPKMCSLSIIEYSITPSANSLYDDEEPELPASADHWSPHLHTLAPKLKELHIHTLQPLRLVHERSLRYLTGLTSLELRYASKYISDRTKPMPRLAATVEVLGELQNLASLTLLGKASEDEDIDTAAGALEQTAACCSRLTKLHFEVKFSSSTDCTCDAPLRLPLLQELVWDTELLLPLAQWVDNMQPAALSNSEGGGFPPLAPSSCLQSLKVPRLRLDDWRALVALPSLASTLTHLESNKVSLPIELLQQLPQQPQQQEEAPVQDSCALLKLAAIRSLDVRLAESRAFAALAMLTQLQALSVEFDTGAPAGEQAPEVDLTPLSKLQGLTSLKLSNFRNFGPKSTHFDVTTLSALGAGLTRLVKLEMIGAITALGDGLKLPGSLRDLELQYHPADLMAEDRYEPILLAASVLPSSLHRLKLTAMGMNVHITGVQPLPLLDTLELGVDGGSFMNLLIGCPRLRSLDVMPACPSSFNMNALPMLAPHLTRLRLIQGMPTFNGTDIEDTGPSFQNFEALGQLTGLQSLVHFAAPHGVPMSPLEFLALEHLTRLTCLDLISAVESWNSAHDAFGQMPALQVLKLHQRDVPIQLLYEWEDVIQRVEVVKH